MVKIVYVDVVGDLFHYGHMRMFEQSLQYGDILYDHCIVIPYLFYTDKKKIDDSYSIFSSNGQHLV